CVALLGGERADLHQRRIAERRLAHVHRAGHALRAVLQAEVAPVAGRVERVRLRHAVPREREVERGRGWRRRRGRWGRRWWRRAGTGAGGGWGGGAGGWGRGGWAATPVGGPRGPGGRRNRTRRAPQP